METRRLYLRVAPVAAGDVFDAEEMDAWAARFVSEDNADSIDLCDSDRAFLVAALTQAGALWDAPEVAGSASERLTLATLAPRGPIGEVARVKLATLDGWYVTAEESHFLAEKLAALLAAGGEVVVRGTDWSVRDDGVPVEIPAERSYPVDAESEGADRATWDWLEQVVEFLRDAAEEHGFEAW